MLYQMPTISSSPIITLPIRCPRTHHMSLVVPSKYLPSRAPFLSPSLPIKTSLISKTFRAAAHSFANSSNAPFLQNCMVTHTSNRQWMVYMESPPKELNTKPQIIDYYVKTLQQVLGSEEDTQMCMYNASCDGHFGFCCDIDEGTARELSVMPGVLSVKPDYDFNSALKDYNRSKVEFDHETNQSSFTTLLFPAGSTKHWVVGMDRPAIGVIRKAPVVDYYVQVLMRVLGNEKDAQMCIYHISWNSNYGFCCELDDECARELADVHGVLFVQPDESFGSNTRNYGGAENMQLAVENFRQSVVSENKFSLSSSSDNSKTKLFVTGLSFYTSEKTLRAAFEGFGEIIEVKIIMDKISKRSKGYGFVEYTTEEAAGTALREMNGKIINGWMITVDAAKKNPPKYRRA